MAFKATSVSLKSLLPWLQVKMCWHRSAVSHGLGKSLCFIFVSLKEISCYCLSFAISKISMLLINRWSSFKTSLVKNDADF